MALGAQPTDVLGLIGREAIQLMAGGVAIGLAVSYSLSHVLTSMLYVVTPTDATTFVAVALTLTAGAAVASYIPARRATRVNPIEALRHD
jgi:ABC-type antimicrobial peptide transport system permease subunit